MASSVYCLRHTYQEKFCFQLSDSAEYVCEAVNVAGRERGSVNVHILVPPTLNTDQGEQHIEVKNFN